MQVVPGISRLLLRRFIASQLPQLKLCTGLCGAHAAGHAGPGSPVEVKGVHLEPTENLVGLGQPPRTFNWVGELEGFSLDFSSAEVGLALHLLLRGDGGILERILSPLQVHPGPELVELQALARAAVSRVFFHYYKDFPGPVLKDYEGHPPRTVRRVLQAYRAGLTGLHLLETGELELDLPSLARGHGMRRLEQLMDQHAQDPDAVLDGDSHWVGGLASLLIKLERAHDRSPLPADPPNPTRVQGYLLDLRRRFFDAATVRED